MTRKNTQTTVGAWSIRHWLGIAATVLWVAGVAPTAHGTEGAAEPAEEHSDERAEMSTATGTFEVDLRPLESYNQDPESKIGRLSIDKTFEGDLAATSQGEMLSGGSPAEGSAGYVAIERVTGALHGKNGSFLLQHAATMTPTSQKATIIVVPGSGTGELDGLTGTMSIRIEDGQHFYDFAFSLPGSS